MNELVLCHVLLELSVLLGFYSWYAFGKWLLACLRLFPELICGNDCVSFLMTAAVVVFFYLFFDRSSFCIVCGRGGIRMDIWMDGVCFF